MMKSSGQVDFEMTRYQCHILGFFLMDMGRAYPVPLSNYPDAPAYVLTLAILGHRGFARAMLKRSIRQNGSQRVTVRLPRWQWNFLQFGLAEFFKDVEPEDWSKFIKKDAVFALFKIFAGLHSRLHRRRGQHGGIKVTLDQVREAVGRRTVLTSGKAGRWEKRIDKASEDFGISPRHLSRLLAKSRRISILD
jgi:hypothetical protein